MGNINHNIWQLFHRVEDFFCQGSKISLNKVSSIQVLATTVKGKAKIKPTIPKKVVKKNYYLF